MGSGGRAQKTAASIILRAPRDSVGRLRHHLHHLHHPPEGVGGGDGARRAPSLAMNPPRKVVQLVQVPAAPRRDERSRPRH